MLAGRGRDTSRKLFVERAAGCLYFDKEVVYGIGFRVRLRGRMGATRPTNMDEDSVQPDDDESLFLARRV